MQTERSIENFSYVGQILDIAHQAFIVLTENCSRAYGYSIWVWWRNTWSQHWCVA